MLEREVALYLRLQEHGVHVSFVTYGGNKDIEFSNKIPGIKVCCNRWNLPPKAYEMLLPFLHIFALRNADIYKTNQTKGAEIALRCSRIWHKKLIARCGYMWSYNSIIEHGRDSKIGRESLSIEELAFTGADRIMVTTPEMKSVIRSKFLSMNDKIHVVPNYVNTDIFHPRTDIPKKNSVCFVGRLAPEKNLHCLMEAIKGMDIHLEIVGQGPLESDLKNRAGQNRQISFTRRIPNHDLPVFLSKNKAFILPSLYEGHPKTLIEAMACGLPVIATDVPGINNLVVHGETGWLCKPTVESLREGIITVLSNPDLQNHLGTRALQFILKNFSLDIIVNKELEIYRTLLRTG